MYDETDARLPNNEVLATLAEAYKLIKTGVDHERELLVDAVNRFCEADGHDRHIHLWGDWRRNCLCAGTTLVHRRNDANG